MKSWHSRSYKLERYTIRALVTVVILLLLLTVFLTFQNSRVIEYNRALQDETERIKVNTLDVIRTLHQMDMGLRGYALIDSEVQLQVATDGFVQMDSIFANLRRSLQPQGFPMQSLAILQDSVNVYLQTVREMIQMVQENRLDEFKEMLKKDLGLYAFYSYSKFSNEVNRFEDQIAAEASERYSQALKNSYLFQIALLCLTTPALLMMSYLFERTVRVSKKLRKAELKSMEAIAGQKRELERQVAERTTEILAQNEEIVSHNEQLLSQQREIQVHREALEEKNEKLETAYKMIEQHHELIRNKNEELIAEVNNQTSDLRKTNLELIQQNSRLEQFTFIVSHNLRAPMARLVGLSDLMQRSSDQEEKEQLLKLLIKSTNEFEQVFKDLSEILTIQKINTDVYSEIRLGDVMARVKDLLEHEIKVTHASVVTDFSDAATMVSLPQYIESILYNLVSNGLKYRDPVRVPHIIVRSETLGNMFCLVVSDNGLGIDLERHKDAVFNLYKRFHFHVEGKGLGLFLVRTQVEALGGRITIESSLGIGTTFRIEFPIAGD